MAIPAACGSCQVRDWNPCHSSDPSHGSNNARSLTPWTPASLIFILICNAPMKYDVNPEWFFKIDPVILLLKGFQWLPVVLDMKFKHLFMALKLFISFYLPPEAWGLTSFLCCFLISQPLYTLFPLPRLFPLLQWFNSYASFRCGLHCQFLQEASFTTRYPPVVPSIASIQLPPQHTSLVLWFQFPSRL